jgi:nitroreductase
MRERGCSRVDYVGPHATPIIATARTDHTLSAAVCLGVHVWARSCLVLVHGKVEIMSDTVRGLLHPLLAARWSPTTFDVSAQVSTVEVESMLEAARWAPSAGNSQPWAFVVGRRGEPDHDRLVRHLAKSSQAWAPTASLLVANLAHRYVEDTAWDYSEFSLYDLGQAVAHMTFQAQSLGLSVRQFRAFDRDGLATEFTVPPHWEVTTMSAIGRVPTGDSARAATTSAGASWEPRDRRPVSDVVWPRAARDHRR